MTTTGMLTEQDIRAILGPRVNAIDHVDGDEWCVWFGGAGHPVWNLDDVLAIRHAIDAQEG